MLLWSDNNNSKCVAGFGYMAVRNDVYMFTAVLDGTVGLQGNKAV
jgi:hypothetical protein